MISEGNKEKTMMKILNVKKAPLLLLLILLVGCETLNTEALKPYQTFMEQQKAHQAITSFQAKALFLLDQFYNREEGRLSPAEITSTLYTQEGELVVYRNGKEIAFRGQQALLDMFEDGERQTIHNANKFSKHFSTNTRIELDGKTASSQSQFFVLSTDRDTNKSTWVIGRYIDTLEKNANGEWRFKSKVAYIDDIANLVSEWESK